MSQPSRRVVAAASPAAAAYRPSPRGGAHDSVIRHVVAQGLEARLAEQGFVLDDGTFVRRAAAARIAFEAGQTKEPKKILFSEDLW